MAKRRCFEIINCIINYDDAKELYDKTKFSIADRISNFWSSQKTKLTFGNVSLHIDLPTLFTDADLRSGVLNIFIKSLSDDAEIAYSNNKDEINSTVLELINGLSEELSKIVVPINNLDNVIYDEATDAFHVKMGYAQPDTIRLSCSSEEEMLPQTKSEE